MFRELDFIERKDGYLDLDSYLLEKYGTISIKNLSKQNSIREEGNSYWIKINDEMFMFKQCTKEEAIKELLADKMLEYVGYDHANYDLACINGEFGVITKNFKKEGYKYISGDELIYTYCNFIDKNVNKEKLDYDRFNNLTDIWDMLEIKYKYYPNKENIVKNIIYNLTENFMFDILINQWDGASYNWLIEESDSYAKFAPIFDNQKMLDGLDLKLIKNSNLKVEEFNDTRKSYSNTEELRKFLNYSSESFKDEFKMLMKSLTPQNIKWLFVTIENNIGAKIDFKIKNSIISRYEYNYYQLENILKEELNHKR